MTTTDWSGYPVGGRADANRQRHLAPKPCNAIASSRLGRRASNITAERAWELLGHANSGFVLFSPSAVDHQLTLSGVARLNYLSTIFATPLTSACVLLL